MSEGQRLKQVHRLAMPIRWGDMDAMGHVNNTIYCGGVLHAEGGAKVVWVNFPAEKSAPLPEGLRALLAQ